MKRKLLSIFIALVLVLSFSLVTAVPVAAQGATWYVATDGSDAFGDGTETWVDADTSLDWNEGDTGPWLTISHTISQASDTDTDTIIVAAGTYSTANGESFPITIDKSLTLKGAQFGTDPTAEGARTDELEESVLDAFDVVGSAIEISVSGVTIDGFTIKNVPSMNVAGDVRYGIEVLPQSGDHSVYSSDIVIENNILADNNRGIYILDNENSLVKKNLIVNCHSDTTGVYSGGTGIALRYIKPTTHITENVLTGNVAGCEYYASILVMYGGYDTQPTITKNLITDNYGDGFGIVLSGGSAIIRGNTITRNPLGGIWTRIGHSSYWVSGEAPLIIEDNIISENGGQGIWITGELPLPRITENTISDNIGAGIQVNDPLKLSDVIANYNDIVNNGYGFSSDVSTDATLNWWGNDQGPDHASNPRTTTGDIVSDNVIFIPWLGAPGGQVCNAAQNESTDEWYFTIQAAINAANPAGGDTITVAAGTYKEAVTIDNSLTLNGAKAGEDARTRDTSSGESILDGTGIDPEAAYPYSTGITIGDAVSNVVIDGFEITNYTRHPNMGGYGSGILVYRDLYGGQTGANASITIQNNYLHDLGWNGVCVGSEANGLIHTDIEVLFNLIEEAPYAGIELTNTADSTVKDNKIVAPTVLVEDPGDAGVGIEIAVRARTGITISVAKVTVENNEITGTFPAGTPGNTTAGSRAGINLLSRTYSGTSDATLTGVTVRGNTVSGGTNVRAGILIVAESRLDGPATITNLLIEGNPLDGNTRGIQIQDFIKTGAGPATHSDISITENDITNSTDTAIAIVSGTSASGIAVNYNNIEGNAYGIKNNTDMLDAENNWWDNASGPTHATTNPFGIGDDVSDFVTYNPWLLVPIVKEQPLPDTYDKTLALKDGWTLISVDKALLTGDGDRAWVGTDLLAEDLPEETIYVLKYIPTGFPEVTTADLEPLTALYVLTRGGGGVGFNYAEDGPAMLTKKLEAGWNLISIPDIEADIYAILSPLRYVTAGTQQVVGLTTLVSQGEYNQFSGDFYLATLTDADWNALPELKLFDGYWANMEAADTFEVIPVP